jgi:nitrate/nitrite transporter NarK
VLARVPRRICGSTVLNLAPAWAQTWTANEHSCCKHRLGPKPGSNLSRRARKHRRSVIEQYDFLVTGVIAATVWGGIFFKDKGLAAVAGAISIYGLGILIRPIGAFIFGHIADRHGRKDALVYALVLMGVSTLLIGLTPTYDSIGALPVPGSPAISWQQPRSLRFAGDATAWRRAAPRHRQPPGRKDRYQTGGCNNVRSE